MEKSWADLSLNKKTENNDTGLVSVTANIKQYALRGVTNKTNVLFELKSGQRKEHKSRAPINLSIVLDVSGSMEGEKLENSKQAIIMIIKRLESKDILHLVTYSSTCKVVFTNQQMKNRSTLIEEVSKIKTDASTNLGIGLELASKVLLSNDTTVDTNKIGKRIFLFSDGLVNEGITDHSKLFEIVKNMHAKGINTTSFGVGGDFDQQLMVGISEHGRGNFFFIENANDIINKVSKGFRVLAELIGTNSILKVRGKNSCIVKSIVGYDDLITGAKIGDICEDDLRTVLVNVEIQTTQNIDEEDILTYEYTYEPVDDKNKHGEVVKLSGDVKIKYTNDDLIASVENDIVLVSNVIAENGEVDKAVAVLVRESDFEKAIKLKEASIENLKKVLPLDKNKLVEYYLSQAEKLLENLKTQENAAEIEKEAEYGGYQASIVHRKCF